MTLLCDKNSSKRSSDRSGTVARRKKLNLETEDNIGPADDKSGTDVEEVLLRACLSRIIASSKEEDPTTNNNPMLLIPDGAGPETSDGVDNFADSSEESNPAKKSSDPVERKAVPELVVRGVSLRTHLQKINDRQRKSSPNPLNEVPARVRSAKKSTGEEKNASGTSRFTAKTVTAKKSPASICLRRCAVPAKSKEQRDVEARRTKPTTKDEEESKKSKCQVRREEAAERRTSGTKLSRIQGRDRGSKPSEIPLRKTRPVVQQNDSQNLALLMDKSLVEVDSATSVDVVNICTAIESTLKEEDVSAVEEETRAIEPSLDGSGQLSIELVEDPEDENETTDIALRESFKFSNIPLAYSSHDVIVGTTANTCRAKKLDLDKLKCLNLKEIVSKENLERLECYHQQASALRKTTFHDRVSSSTSIKLKQQKPSATAVSVKKSTMGLTGEEEALRQMQKTKPSTSNAQDLTEKLDAVVEPPTERLRTPSSKKSERPAVPARSAEGRRNKPPTGRPCGSPAGEPREKMSRSGGRHLSSSPHNSRPSTSDLAASKNQTHSPTKSDGKPQQESPNSESTTFDGSSTVSLPTPEFDRQEKRMKEGPEEVQSEQVLRSQGPEEVQSDQVVHPEGPSEDQENSQPTAVKNNLAPCNSEVNGQNLSDLEKVKIKIVIDLKAEDERKRLAPEDGRACDLTDQTTDEDWQQTTNCEAPVEQPETESSSDSARLKIYRSSSSFKKKSKGRTSLTMMMKVRPKKKKVKSDLGSNPLTVSGRFNSVTSFKRKKKEFKSEAKVRSGLTKALNPGGLVDGDLNLLFKEAAAVNLRRRNSEPNSFRGFIWKQPELAVFRDGKASASSMTSSLTHLNADDLEDFRVWEPAPLKMTSCWEMSLYHCRRPWSVLSCSVFKDNRLSRTPGVILENLRAGGTLDFRGSLFGEKDRLNFGATSALDVEPSIAQKNIDIRNWLAALNFPIPVTASNDAIEGPPVSIPSTNKNQATPKRRTTIRNHSDESQKNKFEDSRSLASGKTNDLLDLIRRKSGGFVTVDRYGQQATTGAAVAVTGRLPCVAADKRGNANEHPPERTTPDLGALKTRSDGPQLSAPQTEDKLQRSDSVPEEAPSKQPPPKEEGPRRLGFWVRTARFLRGEANVNVWKYLFIVLLSFFLYNLLSQRIVAISSAFKMGPEQKL